MSGWEWLQQQVSIWVLAWVGGYYVLGPLLRWGMRPVVARWQRRHPVEERLRASFDPIPTPPTICPICGEECTPLGCEPCLTAWGKIIRLHRGITLPGD